MPLHITEMHGPVNRTSPKGPGSPFVGTCAACGKTGLTHEIIRVDPCPNQRGLTMDQKVIEAITGEPDLTACLKSGPLFKDDK